MLLLWALAIQPAMGQILVASERSHDPDLAKSVVLLIHSDRDGVMGLILNRPQGDSKYFGSPIALGTRTLVHTNPANAQRRVPRFHRETRKCSGIRRLRRMVPATADR
jgi:hypothetical protein